MAKETENLFVKQAEVYKRARPHAPEELYSYLASLTPSHELAWDVGTGNGQAAAVVWRLIHPFGNIYISITRYIRIPFCVALLTKFLVPSTPKGLAVIRYSC